MVDKIERYDGIRFGIRVYGTMPIYLIEEKVASAFLKVSRKVDGDLVSIASLTAADVAESFKPNRVEVFEEVLGNKATSPFHIYRDEPGAIATFFGARPSVVLERGMVQWGYAKRVLDGMVKDLTEEYPHALVR
ncbi:MAG: hypothetical protein AABX04_07140 [Nanoarchaeota archaeon]